MDARLLSIYHERIPPFLAEAARSPALQRLSGVGMNCGCEYTAFPRFRDLAPYSRLEHSIGVGLITWHFTADARQAMAALCHDIVSPCFAHAIDFLNGDYESQESTEAGTAACIDGSLELQAVLSSLGLKTRDVEDYHLFPVADNDTPRLSADRLEYTLGNTVNFGFGTLADVGAIYGDLRVGMGEDGAPELMFATESIARRFCGLAAQCSAVYVSDPDRAAMQALAELLRDAVATGVIERASLWRTEPEVVARLESDAEFRLRWRAFRALNATARSTAGEACPPEDGWRVIPAKKRWIDPLVNGVRASARFPDFAAAMRDFLGQSFEQPLRAFVQSD